jgi:hypothetical protein
MQSAAAYYVLVALNGQQQQAHRQPARAATAKPSRPSLFGRLRAVIARRSIETTPAAA